MGRQFDALAQLLPVAGYGLPKHFVFALSRRYRLRRSAPVLFEVDIIWQTVRPCHRVVQAYLTTRRWLGLAVVQLQKRSNLVDVDPRSNLHRFIPSVGQTARFTLKGVRTAVVCVGLHCPDGSRFFGVLGFLLQSGEPAALLVGLFPHLALCVLNKRVIHDLRRDRKLLRVDCAPIEGP